MNAVAVGPFVFDASRLTAIAAGLLFLLVSTIAARRKSQTGHIPVVEAWAGWAVLAWVLGARLGFVLSHAGNFAAAPFDVLKLWQGGFSARTGWIAAAGVPGIALLKGRVVVMQPLLVAAALTAVAHQAITAALPRPQMQLPMMELLALDGSPVQLAGQDRVTVVNLWATWCPPCRREMPMMTKLAAEMHDVAFLFANQGESADHIFDFLAAETLPPAGMLRDPRGHLMGRLRAMGLPSTLVFDATGALVAAQTGEISGPALRTMIDTAKDQG